MLMTLLAATNAMTTWDTILWLIAAALVIYGLYLIFAKKELALGIVCIVVGLLVGPGGVSLLS